MWLEGRCGRGSSCSQAQPGKMDHSGVDGEGLQPLIPPRLARAEGPQQPLFLRMKACPRTACCISTKARSPTVTWQGPSGSKPHFW